MDAAVFYCVGKYLKTVGHKSIDNINLSDCRIKNPPCIKAEVVD